MKLHIQCLDCGETVSHGIDAEHADGHFSVSIYHECKKVKK